MISMQIAEGYRNSGGFFGANYWVSGVLGSLAQVFPPFCGGDCLYIPLSSSSSSSSLLPPPRVGGGVHPARLKWWPST